MKIMKKIAAMLLCAALMFASVPISANVVAEAVSGSCGDALTWSIADGVLTISGNGTMYDYGTPVTTEEEEVITQVDWEDQPPWYNETVTEIIVEDGVTSIGANAFNGLDYSFVICNPYIAAVCQCPDICDLHSEVNYTSGLEITSVTIPESVTSIGENAFLGCENLTIKGYTGSYAQTYASEKNFSFDILNQCGDNLIWSIADGVLTISGTGDMYDYDAPYAVEPQQDDLDGDWIPASSTTVYWDNCPPWYGETVTAVIIEDGVTSIGDYAFDSSNYSFDIYDYIPPYDYPDVICDECLSTPCVCNYPYYIKTETYESGLEITSVTIPASVTSISETAFSGCESLTVKGYTGSNAQTYAAENGYTFEAIDGENNSSISGDSISGDINGDGFFDANDVTALEKILIGSAEATEAADVNSDGMVDTRDYVHLKKLLAADTPPETEAGVSAVLAVDNVEIASGISSVSLNVTVENNPGIAAARLKIGFDASALEYAGIENGSVFSDCNIISQSGNIITVILDNELDSAITNGTVLTVNFNVVTQTGGSYAVTVTEAECANWSEEFIEVQTVLGGVTIICHPHTFGEWTTVTEPTCNTAGSKVRVCVLCGVAESKTIESIDAHSYERSESGTPGCSYPTTVSYYCSLCGDGYVTQEILLEHDGQNIWQKVTDDSGVTYLVNSCTRCSTELHREEYSGEYTDRVIWSFDEATGTLTISGSGSTGIYQQPSTGYDIEDAVDALWLADTHKAPWFDLVVKNVVIEDGITEIGAHSFDSNEYVFGDPFVLMPGLYEIVRAAYQLEGITIPESVTTIGENAFLGCESLIIKGYTGSYAEIYADENGYTFEKLDIDCAGNHTYGDWIVREAASCESDGEMYRVCSACGEEEAQAIASPGHIYNSWVITTPATCTTDGERVKECSVCGYKVVQTIPATEHKYSAWKVTVSATCTENGTRVKECTKCGEVVTQNYPLATGHNYIETTVEVTCENYGCIRHTCLNCGDTYETDFVAALGHTYNAWQTTKQPTCSEQGERIKECATCGQTVSQPLAVIEHVYKSWVVQTQATCDADGERTKECSMCGYVVSQNIPAAGHNYAETVTAPTCEDYGYSTFNCPGCGDRYNGRYVEALGHNYSETVIAPTEISQGCTFYNCSICGDEYKDNFTPALGMQKIIVSSAVAGKGKVVKLAVSLENNPGIAAFVLGFDYNKTALTLESVEISEELGGNAIISEKAVWYSDADVDYNGEIMVLTFTVADGAEFGDYGVSVTYNAGDISNRNEEDVNFAVTGGKVTVIDHIAGDINGDGITNSKDLTRISKYLAEIEGTVANAAALDVTNDGIINNKDLVLLMRYLAGEAVAIC